MRSSCPHRACGAQMLVGVRHREGIECDPARFVDVLRSRGRVEYVWRRHDATCDEPQTMPDGRVIRPCGHVDEGHAWPHETWVPDVWCSAAATMIERMSGDVEMLRSAVNEAGPSPRLHRATTVRHRAEWPALWRAIDRLLRRP